MFSANQELLQCAVCFMRVRENSYLLPIIITSGRVDRPKASFPQQLLFKHQLNNCTTRCHYNRNINQFLSPTILIKCLQQSRCDVFFMRRNAKCISLQPQSCIKVIYYKIHLPGGCKNQSLTLLAVFLKLNPPHVTQVLNLI